MPPRRGRVLVVEDEDAIGQILAEALTDEGYEVHWARNGRDARDVLQCWLPGLILLDLMMPVMDGVAFRAAQRRFGGSIATVPIIILSASRDGMVQAAEIEAVAALSKPFELTDVIEAVQRWIRTAPSPGTASGDANL